MCFVTPKKDVQFDIYKLLLDAYLSKSLGRFKESVNLNHQNNDGETPLMRSIDRCMPGVPRLFLQVGVDPSIRDCKGHTALDYAITTKQTNVIILIKSWTLFNELRPVLQRYGVVRDILDICLSYLCFCDYNHKIKEN